jgi:Secretion system C-terminal sorting domain
MKIIRICFVFSTFLFGQQQWETAFYDSSNIASNYLYCIDIDNNGTVWAGGETGLIRYSDGAYKTWDYKKSEVPRPELVALKVDNENNVHIASDGTYFLFDGKEFLIPENAEIGSRDIDFDNNLNVWVGSFNGLYMVEDTSLKIVNSESVFPIAFSGDRLFGVNNNFLAEFIDSSWVHFNYEIVPWNQALFVDRFNNLWFCNGEWTNQLIKYDGRQFTEFRIPDSLHYPGAIVQDDYDNLWVGWDGALSKFDGQDWTIYDTTNSPLRNLKTPWVTGIVVDSNNTKWLSTYSGGLLAFNEEGILSAIDDNDDGKLNPNKFSLFQNYPNPFNPETIINYELRIMNDVKLIVYDVLGREVKTLVDKTQQAGKYKVVFNAAGFASGVYYYQLKAGDKFETTRKMLLLR